MNIPKLVPVPDPPLLGVGDLRGSIEALNRVVSAQARTINQLIAWGGLSKVSSDDQDPNWLWDSLEEGDGITLSVVNPATTEKVKIASSAGGATAIYYFGPTNEQSPPDWDGNTELTSDTYQFDADDFNVDETPADVDFFLLRATLYTADDEDQGPLLEIGPTGGSYDMAVDLRYCATHVSTDDNTPPPDAHLHTASGFTKKLQDTGAAMVRTDDDGQIDCVLSNAPIAGDNKCELVCYGYVKGAVEATPASPS